MTLTSYTADVTDLGINSEASLLLYFDLPSCKTFFLNIAFKPRSKKEKSKASNLATLPFLFYSLLAYSFRFLRENRNKIPIIAMTGIAIVVNSGIG